MSQRKCLQAVLIWVCFWLCALSLSAEMPAKKALTFQDIMRFKEIRSAVISDNGKVAAFAVQPGRGDGKVIIRRLDDGKSYTIERGNAPKISSNEKWAAAFIMPKAVDLEKAEKNKPKPGMALLDIRDGTILRFSRVQRFALSKDSRWLAILYFKDEKTNKDKKDKPAGKKTEKTAAGKSPSLEREIGGRLVLHNLQSGEETTAGHVLDFAFDDTSHYLAYSVGSPDGQGNGLFCMGLAGASIKTIPVVEKMNSVFGSLAWSKKKSRLAFLRGEKREGYKDRFFSLWVWSGGTQTARSLVAADAVPGDWMIPGKNAALRWDKATRRIFIGLKPLDMLERKEKAKEAVEQPGDLFDSEKILKGRGVDVWHWNDPFINSHQKKNWPRLREKTYLAVWSVPAKKLIQLGDRSLPDIRTNENAGAAIGISDVPYRKEVTWDGRYADVYAVDMATGGRKKVVSHLGGVPYLSSEGRFILYYKDKNWHLYSVKTGKTRNLTAGMNVPFYNEDHDYPSAVPGYGIAGWIKGDGAVLIYDKFDIWKFNTASGKAANLTAGLGRKEGRTFRAVRLDPDAPSFEPGARLLLLSYHNQKKNFGFYETYVDKPGLNRLLEEKKKFRFLAKARKADVVLFTREDFHEFPDLWVSDPGFRQPRKISEVNPQIDEFAWGEPELVEWNSLDGIPLQGVLIKPAGYQPGRRYPVIVYFYRFFSQRLYEFNQMVINHRPNFPFYTSNGYAIFLPDIRFEVGHPGFSATKCLVPGVQKLIDMGIADPKAIGLHGHSWSGYQTAFIVTQTNIFACCIAGAPVSNMTSAYGGIRWGSGLSRQFQYEKTQSRIGGSLWEYPELYIENSPLFFADRIQTPMLIMFGDKDTAVPWYQGIELYMAMRRLGKDCIFLEYRGEPHHPQKYANKLDYSIRMKEYFDHYLKGKPAPEWIKHGVPYRGK